MNPAERYLSVYDDTKRTQMDRVGTFVQYVKNGFIRKNQTELRGKFEGKCLCPSLYESAIDTWVLSSEFI